MNFQITHKTATANAIKAFFVAVFLLLLFLPNAQAFHDADANGRRTKAVETISGNTRTVDYQYDATGKLLQEKAQEGIRITTTDYQYDKVGNRARKTVNGVTTTYVYNANDQLISENRGQTTVILEKQFQCAYKNSLAIGFGTA